MRTADVEQRTIVVVDDLDAQAVVDPVEVNGAGIALVLAAKEKAHGGTNATMLDLSPCIR
jgi:hypothetical protein